MGEKNINMWYLYILRCADGTLYIGISTDLTKRLKTHNQGKASRYTRMRLPVEMIYHEPHPDKSSARKREIQVKKWPRPQKLALIPKPH
jgi:putative endonuclease